MFLCIHQESTSDTARLVADENRRAQLQAQTDVIDTDLALIEEREEQIRQLEVRRTFSRDGRLIPHAGISGFFWGAA